MSTEAIPAPQSYADLPSYLADEFPPCESCGGKEFAEDHKNGDWICSSCGVIMKERLIATDAEYRVFSEDSSSYSKVRIGDAYNPFMEHSLTERSKLERDEKEFLWDGLKNIEEVLSKLYQGDTVNVPAQYRAKELFQQAFHHQVEQKKGTVVMKRSGSDKKKGQNRLKFSKRKQFVISAVFQALQENKINKWDVEDLNSLMDGINVSKNSVKNCLKDLNVY